MFCKQCAQELVGDAKFCIKCGCPAEELILPASMLQRLAHYLIDIVTATVLSFIIFWISRQFQGLLSKIIFFIGFFSLFFYYLVCETTWQRTLGKLVTKTKVVDRQGNKPSFPKILGRSLARCIPFEAFSFLFGGYPIGWHDALSKTLVVPVNLTPEDVQKMDFVEIKKRKSHNTAATIVVICVAVLFMIAIIGILASVVLASLNVARQKGADASVKANMANLSANAELYASTQNDSYSGFCKSADTLDLLKLTLKTGNPTGDLNYACNDSATNYAISAPLRSGGYWCRDNSEAKIKIYSTLAPEQTSCSSIEKSNTLEDAARIGFINGCTDGKNESSDIYLYCSCAFDGIVKEVGISGFTDMGIKYEQTGELEDNIKNIISSCNYLIK